MTQMQKKRAYVLWIMIYLSYPKAYINSFKNQIFMKQSTVSNNYFELGLKLTSNYYRMYPKNNEWKLLSAGLFLTILHFLVLTQGDTVQPQLKIHNRSQTEKAFLCYWGVWSFYKVDEEQSPENRDAKFVASDIDPHMCTHLIYSFAGLNNQTGKIGSLDPALDFPTHMYEILENENTPRYGVHNMINETMKLKLINPNLQVLIAIGGWGQGSERFSYMASDRELRKTFVESVIAFIDVHKFDGLDFDWEYPAKRGGDTSDKKNFPLLLRDLRRAFDLYESEHGKRLWLTAALGAGRDTVDAAYDIKAISKTLDYLNIMAYDMKVYVQGQWEQVGHHSPLYFKDSETEGNKALAISSAIQYILDLGAAPEKVAMGVGAYGKTFTMKNSKSFNFYDPVIGPGKKYGFSDEPGTIAYNEICYYIAQRGREGWNFEFDYEYYAPFAYNKETWIGYDDELSIMEKVDYAENLGLGGMMIWSIEQDDFRNWCEGWSPNPIGGTVRSRMDYHRDNRESKI